MNLIVHNRCSLQKKSVVLLLKCLKTLQRTVMSGLTHNVIYNIALGMYIRLSIHWHKCMNFLKVIQKVWWRRSDEMERFLYLYLSWKRSLNLIFKAFLNITQVPKCSPVFHGFPSRDTQIEQTSIPWTGDSTLLANAPPHGISAKIWEVFHDGLWSIISPGF